MTYVAQEDQIPEGDVILTSGMGGNYPKSLVIGQVIEVEQRDIDTFQRATVRPSVEFEGLETVLVITTFEPVDVEGAIGEENGTEPQIQATATAERAQNP
jgi:rod shape-determining protein MreC